MRIKPKKLCSAEEICEARSYQILTSVCNSTLQRTDQILSFPTQRQAGGIFCSVCSRELPYVALQ